MLRQSPKSTPWGIARTRFPGSPTHSERPKDTRSWGQTCPWGVLGGLSMTGIHGQVLHQGRERIRADPAARWGEREGQGWDRAAPAAGPMAPAVGGGAAGGSSGTAAHEEAPGQPAQPVSAAPDLCRWGEDQEQKQPELHGPQPAPGDPIGVSLHLLPARRALRPAEVWVLPMA